MKKFASLFAVVVGIVAAAASAQSVITQSGKPYLVQPDIKFSIAAVAVANASRAPASSALGDAPAPSLTPPVAAIAPVVAMVIEKNKRVDEQLRALGLRSGWTLIWEAPDYVLDHSVPLRGDFESSVAFFLAGANESGSRLRATFYRGNKTVRVTEF